ncbi:SigE family RNA polymerase sigma factor [Nocardioides eburneiflavus]|uniref:SigE family RNA polymerase sigma factor n=1 Tax=Nocardioides eburneiflavus TaxID=2518372 RepID=A0A4Z1CDE3_9ACTN|nr:SigE family RNA polymerase sigma factor [Nocardioides eburneiflavus]TGN63128.1 SigE family RNA polymerase sigma factor [Nocardioides eburneiflavus]
MADPELFDAFVVARSPSLLRTAYLLTHDRGLAEDLVQTTLTKTWFAWGRLNDDDPVRYVRRVLVATSVSWHRRLWVRERPTAELPEQTAEVGDSPEAHDLWVAIGHLPPRQRAVVVLRYYEDLSEAETAQLLGCSVGTVKSQCSKAMSKLRVDAALVPLVDDGSRS